MLTHQWNNVEYFEYFVIIFLWISLDTILVAIIEQEVYVVCA